MFSNKLWRRLGRKFKHKDRKTAVVLPRSYHDLSRAQISPNALKVLYRLQKAGYAAFLVGGSVRDILLGNCPKDFDIATDARPEEIYKLFRNSRIIGRRFRLVHIFFHDEIIEASTFRANSEDQDVVAFDSENDELTADHELPKMIQMDNTYGTIEEDAWRRDFTINSLYYNIEDFSVIDYTGGMLDLKRRKLRMIGDPVQRYHEDPVRLLRAIRLAAKLNFKIEEQTEKPISKLADLLHHVPPSRLFDEILKLFFKGHALVTYERLNKYGYMDLLFPQTAMALRDANAQSMRAIIKQVMASTDQRLANKKTVNPGFLFAVILWPALQIRLAEERKKHTRLYQAMHVSIEQVIHQQVNIVMIPKRFSAVIRSIWLLQYHLISRRGKRVYRTFKHRYFRAAYDFLELRVQVGEPYKEQLTWWKEFQRVGAESRQTMIIKLQEERQRK